jgi:hypothetical protein
VVELGRYACDRGERDPKHLGHAGNRDKGQQDQPAIAVNLKCFFFWKLSYDSFSLKRLILFLRPWPF